MAEWNGDELVEVIVLRHLTEDHRLMFTSLERWVDRVTLNWASPQQLKPSDVLSGWRVEDDAGTPYRCSGAGSGGGASGSQGWATYTPAAPPTATQLYLVSTTTRIRAGLSEM